MIRGVLSTRLAVALLATTALLSCGKSASPPNGFGVNVTVDASALSAANISAAKKGRLTVVVNTDPPQTRTFDVSTAIQSREIRFHYTPDPAVVAGDKLTMGFDVLDVKSVAIASGSAKPVTLTATAVSVTIKLEDGGGGGGDGGPTDGSSGKANGTACAAGTECGSGFCADGVCCNEKCTDVCVSCNQATAKGTCTPFAVDTDPEMECGAVLPPMTEPDAGAAPVADGATGGDGPAMGDAAKPAGDAAGAVDAGPSDAVVINTPDGGFMSMPTACAGKCGGTRACKYPGKEKPCGTSFCNASTVPGSFVCDGAGGCNIELSSCTAYGCDDTKGSCRTQCTGHEDCAAGYYCDGATHCLPRKSNSVSCGSGLECKSGHCAIPMGAVQGVCCNTACTGMGLSCNDPGKVGMCVCQGVTCAAGVACQVFFQDADADTFGNRNGTIAAGTAKAGCMGAAPPPGFVADNTDCDDTDANAKPGQTMFFGVQRKGGGFDFDCDDKVIKETPEYVNGTCRFCGAVGACDATTTTCTSANQTASFQCPQEFGGIIRGALPPDATLMSGALEPEALGEPTLPTPGRVGQGVPVLPPSQIIPPICKLCVLQCCGCAANDKTGFRQVVACGVSTVSAYTCGSCSVAGGAASPMTTSFRQQKCR